MELGFDEYVAATKEVSQEYREHQKSREKRQTIMEQSGLTEEELLRQQEELFGRAREKYNQEAQG